MAQSIEDEVVCVTYLSYICNMIKLFTGFEPTRIITRDRGLDEVQDVLENTGHLENFRRDIELVKEHGIDLLRVAVPWHRIEEIEGTYDWRWIDEYMEKIKECKIDPILDPLHHVSIPSYLKGGWLDEKFVKRYLKFFEKLVERYSWVRKYTIVNEPLVTTWFCTHEGTWYPFARGKENFEKGLSNIFSILKEGVKIIGDREHWYVDAAEEHRGFCEASLAHADNQNRHRFRLIDMLIEAGVRIDVLGLDYYPHCEFDWAEEGRVETENPSGFYEVAKQYIERYHLPIALTETNIRGYITDRQSWFIHMYKECLKLEKICDFRGFCWYPFIDSTDWDSLVTQNNKNIDPQGIIYLDEQGNRNRSEFSENIKKLNKREINIEDFPIYPYLPPMNYLEAWHTL